MQSPKQVFSRIRAAGFIVLSVFLAAGFLFLYNNQHAIPFNQLRHQLLVLFAIFIAVGLAGFCLMEHYRNRSMPFLVWGLGLLLFTVFNALHILSLPGAALSGFRFSVGQAVGFQSAGNLFLALALFSGLARPPSESSIKEWGFALVASLAAVWLVSASSLMFLADGQVTLPKRLLDGGLIGIYAAAAVLVIYAGTQGKIRSAWVLTAIIFGIFSKLCLLTWTQLSGLGFEIGQVTEIVFLASLAIAAVAIKRQSDPENLPDRKGLVNGPTQPVAGLLDEIHDAILVTTPAGDIRYANRSAVRLFGYAQLALQKMNLSDLMNAASHRKLLDFTADGEHRLGSHLEIDFLSKEDALFPTLVRVLKTADADGRTCEHNYIIRDLSDRKEFEQRLEHIVRENIGELRFFKQCIQHATEGIIIVDRNENITYANAAFEQMSGFHASELVGKETKSLAQNPQAQVIHHQIWLAVRAGKVWRGEFGIRRKDASTFLGQLSVVPISGSDGDETRYIWVQHDITRRKALEKSLQEYTEKLTDKTRELENSKFYYESLIEGLSDILIVVDNEGQCIFLNRFGRQRLGLKAEEVTRQHLPTFFDDLLRLERDYGSTLKLEIKDFEAALTPKEGEPFVCSWSASPLLDRSGIQIGAMAVARDVSEFKSSERDLQEHVQKLERKAEDEIRQLKQGMTELTCLAEIGKEIQSKTDLDVILNKVGEAVVALGWGRALVWLHAEEGETSRVVATAGLSGEELETVMAWGDIASEYFEPFFKDEHRVGNSYYVKGGRETSLPFLKLTLDERGDEEWQAEDILMVPIRSRANTLGLIALQDPENRQQPTVRTVTPIESFAGQAAAAIENEAQTKKQKETERRAKFVAEIGKLFYASLKLGEVVEVVAHKGATSIGEFCAVLLDDGSGSLKLEGAYHHNPRMVDLFRRGSETFPVRTGDPLLGKVGSTLEPLLISLPWPEDFQNLSASPFAFLSEEATISSIMAVPLRAQGKVIGTMVYVQFDKRRIFREPALVLAQELADRASLALQNAILFTEAGEKAKELEKASRLKSQFLANVSHELRTPLNAIITLSDILSRRFAKGEFSEENKQLNIIRRSGHNLLNLINDILDLAKIEAGKAEPIYTSIPIRGMIEETVEHMRPLCIQKGLELRLDIASRFPEEIYSDEEKVTRALTNVLTNAVKFTRGGKVHVKAKVADKNNLEIKVSDTGIGIPGDRLDEIFKEFHQVESTDSRTFGGTGLGLAIARNVLTLLGGSIAVSSQLGKGSTFTIKLPVRTRKELHGVEVFEPSSAFSSLRSLPFKAGLEDDRDNLKPNRRTVLVVDDEAESLYIIAYYLRQQNYQVIIPQQGEDPVDLAKDYRPVAVVLDVIMPARSGWEVLRDLKDDPATAGIPVVMVSILAERARALEMGADEYLVKPFKPESLQSFLLKTEKKQRKKTGLVHIARFLTGKNSGNVKAGSRTEASAGEGRRILLVDDDDDSQYALQLILEGAGYEVAFAKEGRDALKQAEALNPNLILMDIMMPGMDGYEAARTLKRNERLKDVPIVAVTAKAMKGDRERTLQAGCDDYIAKPFVTEEILRMVRKWADGRRHA